MKENGKVSRTIVKSGSTAGKAPGGAGARKEEEDSGLELLRRVPEQPEREMDPATAGLLAGVLLSNGTAETAAEREARDVERALAVRLVRKRANEHKCTRDHRGAPSCRHFFHYRDVAQARWMIEMLGLPGTLELLPLAEAVKGGT